MTAIRRDDEWAAEANATGEALAAGSSSAVVEALARKAVVLDNLFYRTIEDAMRAPLEKRAALLREARGFERDARAVYNDIDKFSRRIVIPAGGK